MTTLARTKLAALAVALASCRSTLGSEQIPDELLGSEVFTRVGMHFDTKRGRYVMASTNYISMPIYLPPGSALTLTKKSDRGFTLVNEEGTEHIIEFRPKHSMMPIHEYYELHFSSSPLQLPASLSEEDLDNIAEGVVRPGMSRAAVFLAIGYPPRSITPSPKAASLRYDARRFISMCLHFDDNNAVRKITR